MDENATIDTGPHATVPEGVARRPDGSPARLSGHQVADALEGAITFYEHTSDNDTEAMFLTRGGQYVRRTGEDADAFYVLPRDEAREVAEGYLDETDLDLVMP